MCVFECKRKRGRDEGKEGRGGKGRRIKHEGLMMESLTAFHPDISGITYEREKKKIITVTKRRSKNENVNFLVLPNTVVGSSLNNGLKKGNNSKSNLTQTLCLLKR